LFEPRTVAFLPANEPDDAAARHLPTAVVHIFAITVAIGPAFVGTRFISGLMLLANGYLVCWDWDR
jgi:hypothetical protein